MAFKTTREVQYDGKTYAAGKSIPVADDTDAREQLLVCGAIVADKAAAQQPGKPAATADMPKAQLIKMAAAAKVSVAKKEDGTEIPIADATEAQIALAINSGKA